MKKYIVNFVIIGFVFFPFILWILWLINPSIKTKILILDKTVLTNDGPEHLALDWVLSHRKYFKKDGTFYSAKNDYFGFFPLEDEKFKIKDLSNLSERQIDSLSNVFDMTYFTDTYGIYTNEWYQRNDISEHSGKVYGGLEKNDVLFLQRMKEKKKLIMAEFNFFATPTATSVKIDAEQLLGLRWSGWTGRYFEQLDTLKNSELPKWISRLYKEQHHNQWPFTKPGIVFINSDERIAILESETDLTYGVPVIKSFNYGVKKFDIPKEIRYPFWFDITLSTDTTNKVISYYEIFSNKKGDSILQHHNIPRIFPAAFEHLDKSPYYYFCGDFTDSPIHVSFIKFIGIQYLKMLVNNESDLNDRTPFFWRYYLPMTSKILDDYFKNRKEL